MGIEAWVGFVKTSGAQNHLSYNSDDVLPGKTIINGLKKI